MDISIKMILTAGRIEPRCPMIFSNALCKCCFKLNLQLPILPMIIIRFTVAHFMKVNDRL